MFIRSYETLVPWTRAFPRIMIVQAKARWVTWWINKAIVQLFNQNYSRCIFMVRSFGVHRSMRGRHCVAKKSKRNSLWFTRIWTWKIFFKFFFSTSTSFYLPFFIWQNLTIAPLHLRLFISNLHATPSAECLCPVVAPETKRGDWCNQQICSRPRTSRKRSRSFKLGIYVRDPICDQVVCIKLTLARPGNVLSDTDISL